RQSACKQGANQRRGSAFVPKESGRREHVQLRRQGKARPRPARTHCSLEESDRDARGGGEDRVGINLWRSRIIAHSRRRSGSKRFRVSKKSPSGVRSGACLSRRKRPAVATTNG